MNGIISAGLNKIVFTMDRDETQTESGITKLIDMLDEYLTPNPFLKLEQTYRQCKTREKNPEKSWDEFEKRMKRFMREMNEAEMTINDRVFCIALLEGSNQAEATTINIEIIAGNKEHWGTKARMDPIMLEQTLRRFTVKENQTLTSDLIKIPV